MSRLVFLLPGVAWIMSLLATKLVLAWLTRVQVLDNPNERSNHTAPVPRGGGIAMMGVALVCLFLAGVKWQIVAGGVLLGAVSFVDDVRGLPARVRLLVQCVAVAIALPTLPLPMLPVWLPSWCLWVGVAVLWLWFINLTNFMDGIDGISAMQAIMQSVGIILLHSLVSALPLWLPVSAGILAACALGFLRFNRSPAQIFMGDVGSIPLGFVMGYLLLSLAAYGHPVAALLLPAYYLTDATFTLARRALRGEKIWQAHSQHAYQQAVRRGLSHNAVVLRITGLNTLLVVLALCPSHSMMAASATLVAGYLAAFLLIRHLSYAPSAR